MLTPSHSNSGQATKIDDRVPITMPMICASAIPRSDPPPYRYSATTVSNATNEVITVRDRVWLTDLLSSSFGGRRSERKFSRTRSNTTMVSLIENPMTDSRPASTVRSNSCPLRANQPAVISTSCSVATIAASANFHSKRAEMYTAKPITTNSIA